MNNYDVVCVTGKNCYILKTIKAENQYQAQKEMWDKFLDEQQRKNCLDVFVYSEEVSLK